MLQSGHVLPYAADRLATSPQHISIYMRPPLALPCMAAGQLSDIGRLISLNTESLNIASEAPKRHLRLTRLYAAVRPRPFVRSQPPCNVATASRRALPLSFDESPARQATKSPALLAGGTPLLLLTHFLLCWSACALHGLATTLTSCSGRTYRYVINLHAFDSI